MKPTCLLMCAYLTFLNLSAQDGHFTAGARHRGLGGTSLTLTDHWSVFNNPGALSGNESTAFASYFSRFSSKAFQVMTGGYVHHAKWVTGGLNFFRFGDDLFNQQRLGLALSRQIHSVSLGGNIAIIQYHVESQDTRRVMTYDFGGLVTLIPKLHLAASISNMNEPQLSLSDEIPFIMKTGLSYRPQDGLMLNIEFKKEIDRSGDLKFGLEYAVHSLAKLRTGFSSHSKSMAFGFGISPGKLQFDYAFSYANPIGVIHELSLAYKPRQR
ncbi:MAG: hypothetical protein JXQ90_06915 [Cyclobacteriaceae bacterium]